MKNKSILFSVALASLLQAEQVTSIEYINLTKVSTVTANETIGIKVGEELDISKINSAINCCHKGTPKGMRISITTGDVNGINENTVDTTPCGSSITVKTPI